MWLMLQQDKPDDYIVATGTNTPIREFKSGIHSCQLNYEDHVVTRQDLLRPAEVDVLLGDASKARHTLAWAPLISLQMIP